MASLLEALAGGGPTRRKKLLVKFGSLEGIRAASVDELAEIVPRSVAQSIKDGLGG